MKYTATLGMSSWAITSLISLFFGGLTTFLVYRVIQQPSIPEVLLAVVLIGVVVSVYVLAYLYRPLYYVIDENQIVIRRPIKDIVISIRDVKDAYIIRKESMGWTERVGGNGGLFGFYGTFRNNFGIMKWYATRRNNYVMIEVNQQKIILTPDDTGMVKEIRKLIGK